MIKPFTIVSIILHMISLAALYSLFFVDGIWYTYSPRPGIECVTYVLDREIDIECYKIEENNE